MRLLLDIDDSVVDLRTPTRKIFAEHKKVFIEGIDFCGGRDTDAYRFFQSYVNSTPGFCRSLETFDGAKEIIHAWLKMPDVEVTPVTAPQFGPHWIPERTAFLVEEFGFDEQQIHYCWKKHKVDGDLIFEDNPFHIKSWLEAHPDGKAILRAHPWTWEIIVRDRELSRYVAEGQLKVFESWAIQDPRAMLFKHEVR